MNDCYLEDQQKTNERKVRWMNGKETVACTAKLTFSPDVLKACRVLDGRDSNIGVG